MTMDAVDKATIGLTGKQYHVGVETGDISDIVLMPGDPFRVQLIADQLENAVEIAHRREYRTVNGYYKGRLITGCSSGMGCPSTAIGVEELARAGAKVFIRVGSTAALQPNIGVGDLIISEVLSATTAPPPRTSHQGTQPYLTSSSLILFSKLPVPSARNAASPSIPASMPLTTPTTQRPRSGSTSFRASVSPTWTWKVQPCLSSHASVACGPA